MIYATVAEFRQYLPQVDQTDAEDGIIQDALERATDLVSGALGIPFFDTGATWPAASAKTIFSEGSVWLKLPAYREGSITQITVAGESAALTDYEERWGDGRSYLWRESGWGGRRYTVTAVWGYGPPPPAIVEVTLECAINIWRMRDRGMFQEVQTGPGSAGAGATTALRFIGGLTSQQRAIIDQERRRHRDGVY